jgi:hypothetical protein
MIIEKKDYFLKVALLGESHPFLAKTDSSSLNVHVFQFPLETHTYSLVLRTTLANMDDFSKSSVWARVAHFG